MPYRPADALLSKGERAFYDALAHALGEWFVIMTKVCPMDLLALPGTTPNHLIWVRRAAQKHVDFVICHRAGVRPFLIVELDDHSHRTARASKRDAFVDAALQQAGWPIERIAAQQAYDVADLADRVGRHADVNARQGAPDNRVPR